MDGFGGHCQIEQIPKYEYYMFSLICGNYNVNPIDEWKRMLDNRNQGRARRTHDRNKLSKELQNILKSGGIISGFL